LYNDKKERKNQGRKEKEKKNRDIHKERKGEKRKP
jgi:hypothetical protein